MLIDNKINKEMIEFINQITIMNNLVELYDNLKEKIKMLSMFEELFSILFFIFYEIFYFTIFLYFSKL